MEEKQKELGAYFIAELGKVVGNTMQRGADLGLSKEQAQEVVRTSLSLMVKLQK